VKYSIWEFIWDTTEIVYKYTGIRIQAPIEWFFPNFGPWLLGKMIGCNGEEITNKKE